MLIHSNVKWDNNAELVIVGYGMAGAVAAITAHYEGAKVLVIEKQPSDNHCTNSSLSVGVFIVPSDIDGAVRYMEALDKVSENLYWTDRDIIRCWAEYACENKDWMEKLGIKTKLLIKGGEHSHLPGSGSIQVYGVPGMGLKMMTSLYHAARDRGIEVMYDTAAQNLLTDAKGEIIGVRARQVYGRTSKDITVEASKAVILTCGGFEFNEQMKLNYLPVYPTYFVGSPANTGDGIRMALDIGADLWHMNCVSAGAVARFPDSPRAFATEFGGPGWLPRHVHRDIASRELAGYIVVDKKGERFINENNFASKSHTSYYEFTMFDSERLEYPRVPSYWIFDQNRIEVGPLVHTKGETTLLYRWSRDNNKELERGWIIKADAIIQLAANLNMKPEVLQNTVGTYNTYCEKGEDPDFGRGVLDLIPLSRPPFYAMKLWPGGPNTQGGPRRNSRAQVLDTAGKPIPRLYAAGELGSIFGKIYPSAGGNLSECISFGRIAAKNAARETYRK